MKRIFQMTMVPISLLFLNSCEKIVGEGPVVTQQRDLQNFKRVSVSISGKVNYHIDPIYKVELRAQQNILDVIETRLIGDELLLKIKEGKHIRSHETIEVDISGPFANAVNLSGSADFKMLGNLTTTNLELRVSGSGNIQVEKAVVAEMLTGIISGSGNISITNGTGKNENLRVSGSGNIDFSNLLAERAIVEISGSGNTKVNLSQKLDASISGSGSVYYKGAPLISSSVSGSGSVRPF